MPAMNWIHLRPCTSISKFEFVKISNADNRGNCKWCKNKSLKVASKTLFDILKIWKFGEIFRLTLKTGKGRIPTFRIATVGGFRNSPIGFWFHLKWQICFPALFILKMLKVLSSEIGKFQFKTEKRGKSSNPGIGRLNTYQKKFWFSNVLLLRFFRYRNSDISKVLDEKLGFPNLNALRETERNMFS